MKKQLPVEQIFQYIVPHGWKVHRDMLLRLAEESSIIEAIIELKISPYDELLKSVPQTDGNLITNIELHLLRYLYRESLEVLMKFPLQSALLVAFFIMKEMQIRDIITVLTGSNPGVSQERIRSYMITL